MPIDVSQVQPLIQRELNLMETVACWARKAAKKAHLVGLQGEKRRLRYLYRKAAKIVDWTEHKVLDHLKMDISAQPGTIDVSSLTCCKSTMIGIIDRLWTIRDQAGKLSNELIMANHKRYSKKLDKYVSCLDKILGDLQRADTEYEKADYDYHHVSRYQVSYYNVHDEYKKKENKQGYKA